MQKKLVEYTNLINEHEMKILRDLKLEDWEIHYLMALKAKQEARERWQN